VLKEAGMLDGPVPRLSMVDPYVPFIRETIEKYPTITAARLYEMVKERGYAGGSGHFRHLVAKIRPPLSGDNYSFPSATIRTTGYSFGLWGLVSFPSSPPGGRKNFAAGGIGRFGSA
jgi:hypothetical protein